MGKKRNKKVIQIAKQIVKESIYKDFLDICRMSQEELKTYLASEMSRYGYEIKIDDGYIYCKQLNTDVLLTAHMDTVHKEEPKEFFEKQENGKHILSSPQGIGGDDRCGIYMILSIIRETDYRPAILFCEDEEIGGVGSNKFVMSENNVKELSKLKFFIELDRANANDLVYYDDDNYDFHTFCERETGYKEDYGSFSDISVLSPDSGISSVNISCGYYHAHTLKEEVVWEEMLNSIETTKKLLAKANDVERFEYVEAINYKSMFGFKSYDDYIYYNTAYNRETNNSGVPDEIEIVIEWIENGKPRSMFYCGVTIEECLGLFFIDHPDVCFNDLTEYYEA